MYNKEDFQKDFNELKEILKSIDLNNDEIKKLKEDVKNIIEKLKQALKNKDITKEEFKEYFEKIKTLLKNKFDDKFFESLDKNISNGFEKIIICGKNLLNKIFKK